MSAPTIDRQQVIDVLRAGASEIDQLTYARISYTAVDHILRSVAPDWYTAQAALVALADYLRATGSDDGWVSTWSGVIERGAAASLMRAAAASVEQAQAVTL